MSDTPDEAVASALEEPERPAGSSDGPDQELTLDQLDEHIAGAEAQHQELSARLDAIPRD